jgi:[ribosomal protein S18]-alanine N-acetyltransferase
MCVETEAAPTPEPMNESDLEEVLDIERGSFEPPWSREMFLEEISNRNARLMVFRLEGKIVGYMCFWAVLDEAHLLNVAVHPAYRSRGYGRTIMAHLEALCRSEGLKRIILEVGRRNEPARHLYKLCGFSSIGFRKQYYAVVRDDALVMEKWLGQPEAAEDLSDRLEVK